MPAKAARLTVTGLGAAAAGAGPSARGKASFTVTVRSTGSTVTTNVRITGTDWAAAVSGKPRPSRGSSQPSAIVSTPMATVNRTARGLAIADTATPGFQAKKIAAPSPATPGTTNELRGIAVSLRANSAFVVCMTRSTEPSQSRYSRAGK